MRIEFKVTDFRKFSKTPTLIIILKLSCQVKQMILFINYFVPHEPQQCEKEHRLQKKNLSGIGVALCFSPPSLFPFYLRFSHLRRDSKKLVLEQSQDTYELGYDEVDISLVTKRLDITNPDPASKHREDT